MNGFPGYRVTIKERKPRGPYTCQTQGVEDPCTSARIVDVYFGVPSRRV